MNHDTRSTLAFLSFVFMYVSTAHFSRALNSALLQFHAVLPRTILSSLAAPKNWPLVLYVSAPPCTTAT